MKSEPMQAQRPAQHPGAARWPMQTIVAPRVLALATLSTVVALSTLVSACRPRSVGNASPSQTFTDGNFRWTLTRLEGASPERQVGWLDNETILFIGSNDSHGSTPEISGLYAWNRKGPARLVLPHAYRFCFDGKTWTAKTAEPQSGTNELVYRRYRMNPSDLSTAKLGADQTGPSHGSLNPYTCNWEMYPAQLSGRHWDHLRPQDGYLDFGASGSRNQEVHLLRPDLKKRIPLGTRIEEPTGRKTRYSAFLNSYTVNDIVFSPHTLESWNREGRFIVHSIRPDGTSKDTNIRPGPWSLPYGGDRAIELAKPGIVIASKGGPEGKSSPIGLYLIRGKNKHTRIDTEVIESLSVSPNGCEVAYIRHPRRLIVTLQVINLCTNPP